MTENNQTAKFDITIKVNRLAYNGVTLFNSLQLDLPGGTWTCLLGVSGVGKTTLLKLVAGLTQNSSCASIRCSDGQPLTNRVAYMAQQDLLMPWLTVIENVTLGDRLRRISDPVRYGLAYELIDRVGLLDYARELPANLSGGMRQRVALARTLLEDRPVVLMDEPFSALDVITRLRLQEMAADLLKDRTVLLVTHDPLEALRIGNHIFLMKDQPALLEKIAELTDPAPRDIKDRTILSHQADLLSRMKKSNQEKAS